MISPSSVIFRITNCQLTKNNMRFNLSKLSSTRLLIALSIGIILMVLPVFGACPMAGGICPT